MQTRVSTEVGKQGQIVIKEDSIKILKYIFQKTFETSGVTYNLLIRYNKLKINNNLQEMKFISRVALHLKKDMGGGRKGSCQI